MKRVITTRLACFTIVEGDIANRALHLDLWCHHHVPSWLLHDMFLVRRPPAVKRPSSSETFSFTAPQSLTESPQY